MGAEEEFQGMLSYEDALVLVLGKAWRLPSERVELDAALHRVLAQDAVSDMDMPPFDKSAVDGYACRSEDTGNALNVVGIIPAGVYPERVLCAGETLKIMTGAPMPAGADCVVMKEHVDVLPDGHIRVTEAHAGKRNYCPRGEDVRKGDTVLRAGTRLAPQHLAVLATIGITQPNVSRRVRVGIFSTGTELVAPESTPGLGQIRNSNSAQIAAQAELMGAEVRRYGVVSDSEDELLKTVLHAMKENDIVVSTGGVSVGDFDLMPEICTRAGAEIHLRKVAIQPGKPVVFATTHDKAIFALSGNPVSSFLQFTLFVEAFDAALSGTTDAKRWVSAPLTEDMSRNVARRMQWFPVAFTPEGHAAPLPFHGSAHVHGLADAHGLAAYPVGVDTLRKGETIKVLLLG